MNLKKAAKVNPVANFNSPNIFNKLSFMLLRMAEFILWLNSLKRRFRGCEQGFGRCGRLSGLDGFNGLGRFDRFGRFSGFGEIWRIRKVFKDAWLHV